MELTLNQRGFPFMRFMPMNHGRWVRMLALLGLIVALEGCVTSAPRLPEPPVAPQVEDLELRSLLLLLEDRRLFEPAVLLQASRAKEATRVAAARTLGRLGDPRGASLLVEMLADASARVREAAAFALGVAEFPEPTVDTALLGVVNDQDRQVAIAALRSLARRNVPLERASAALGTPVDRDAAEGPGASGSEPATSASARSKELWSRLLPALAAFPVEQRQDVARLALREAPETLRWLAALAILHQAPAAALPDVRKLARSSDPRVLSEAALALGRLGDRSDLDRLLELTQHDEATVRAAAFLGASRLFQRAVVAAGEPWRERVLVGLDDAAPVVRFAALGGAPWALRDRQLAARLEQRFADTGAWSQERGFALLALALGEEPRAVDLMQDAAHSDDEVLRAYAAFAAAATERTALLEKLSSDVAPRVRVAALRGLVNRDAKAQRALLAALEDRVASVRAAAYSLLAQRPLLRLEELLHGPAGSGDLEVERDVVARRGLVTAVAARGHAQRLERGEIVGVLERVAKKDPAREVRAAAIDALRSFGRPVPELTPAQTSDQMEQYRNVVRQTTSPVRLLLQTDIGELRFEIACPEAPRSCLSVMQLVEQGFYDGLSMEPFGDGLSLELGDPDGTGHGGPGYRTRDELNALPYDRGGVLRLERPYPDGMGSRLVLSLRAEPWRAGSAVTLGRYVGGEVPLARVGAGVRVLAGEVVAIP